MIVTAFDLSLGATGVARPDGGTETIGSGLDGVVRLADLRDQLVGIVVHDRADLVVIEGYAMGSARQSYSYAIGELGGVFRLWLWETGIPFVDIPPASLKKYATGHGKASKDAVYGEAIRRLGYPGESKDEADALWLRAMTLDQYGAPLVAMPKVNREALAAVPWPILAVAA